MHPNVSDELPILDLNSIASGSAFELFENELKKVLANIVDPNCEPGTTREIVMKATFKPGAERSIKIELTCKSKLAPAISVGGMAFVGVRRGIPVATTFDMQQTQLQWDEADKPRTIAGTKAARTGTED